jgi:phage shock protein PspC (stress-responsive transcriptional regulator)
METHDPNRPQRPDEEPTREEGGEAPPGGPPGGAPPQPGPAPGAAPARGKLYRSRSDRVFGGVCGGLGKHFGIDPVILRVLAVVLLLLGGGSLIAYLIMMVVVPNEPVATGPEGAAPAQAADSDTTKPLAIAAIVVLLLVGWPFLLGGGFLAVGLALPLAILGGVGLLVWWLVSGESPGDGAGGLARAAALGVGVLLLCFAIFTGGAWAAGVGGGAAAAALVIAAGVALVVGAFAGGLRLLILPALALALGVGFVQAADIDLGGGVGQKEYRPASASDLHDRYQLGIGQLVVDLRQADLPKGDTPLRLKVGVGDALVLVPRDVCVASKADIGMGGVDVFDRDNGGIDVAWADRLRPRAGNSRVMVDADVGVGALEIRHDRHNRFDHRLNGEPTSGNEGCAGA